MPSNDPAITPHSATSITRRLLRLPISRSQARSSVIGEIWTPALTTGAEKFLTAIIQFRRNGVQLSVYTEPFGEIESYERFSSD